MFACISPNKTELNFKRHSLIKQIHNSQRESIKKRARSQILHFISLQNLQQIVAKSQHQFKKDYLPILVKYSNAQFPIAVGCLGNLIIDQIVRVSQLEHLELKPGYHPNWLWLIEVLVDNEYCTSQLLQHCIKSLSPKRSVQTRQRALSILLKVTVCNMHPVEWIKDHNTLLSILNCCLSSEKFNQIAFGLLYQLLSKCNERDINNFRIAIVAEKIVAILSQGSLNKSRKIKILSCKIISQLSQKSILLPTIHPLIIRLIKHAKTNSYLESALVMLRIVLERVNKNDLMALIDAELIVELGILKQALMDEAYEEWIIYKVVQLGCLIEKLTRDCQFSQGIYRQLKRFQLLRITDKMDIY